MKEHASTKPARVDYSLCALEENERPSVHSFRWKDNAVHSGHEHMLLNDPVPKDKAGSVIDRFGHTDIPGIQARLHTIVGQPEDLCASLVSGT